MLKKKKKRTKKEAIQVWFERLLSKSNLQKQPRIHKNEESHYKKHCYFLCVGSHDWTL